MQALWQDVCSASRSVEGSGVEEGMHEGTICAAPESRTSTGSGHAKTESGAVVQSAGTVLRTAMLFKSLEYFVRTHEWWVIEDAWWSSFCYWYSWQWYVFDNHHNYTLKPEHNYTLSTTTLLGGIFMNSFL